MIVKYIINTNIFFVSIINALEDKLKLLCEDANTSAGSVFTNVSINRCHRANDTDVCEFSEYESEKRAGISKDGRKR